MGITRIGNKKIQRALKKWGSDIEDKVSEIVYETARIIEAQAKALAPVDEGNLRDSIELTITGKFSAMVQVGTMYAIYVEYGTGIYSHNGTGRKTPWSYYSPKLDRWVTTRGMAPQPFWFPAVEAGEKYFNREFRKLGK